MGSRTTDCRKFSPNIFNKSKCSHCFRQREEHSAAALECNRATRKVSKCGYLFVAPDWDFSNPLYRTKRWQRRWFVLYDDGEFTYSVDDHPETIPQASIDMTKVIEVASAEDVTGHSNSLAITAPDRVTFVKGTCPEEAKWWLTILSAFPKIKGRHKRNATFPGGQSTANIQSSTIQQSRCRLNSYHQDVLPSATKLDAIPVSWNTTTCSSPTNNENNLKSNNENNLNSNRVYVDQPIISNSPPTRDKLHPEGKAQTRLRNRNRNNQDATDSASQCLLIEDALRDEKLKNIANTITNISSHQTYNAISSSKNPSRWSQLSPADEKPTRDKGSFSDYAPAKIPLRPKSLHLAAISSAPPSIVSAIIKKLPPSSSSTTSTSNSSNSEAHLTNTLTSSLSNNNSNTNTTSTISISTSTANIKQQHQSNERGDPDGGCNLDDLSSNYLSKTSELMVNLPSEELLNSKKGWLLKQDLRSGDWSKYWFHLRGAALFYYRDPMAEERGVLDGVLDVNGLTAACEIPVARNYGFQLLTWDNRRIVLATVNANTRNNWLNVIRCAAGLVTQQPQVKEITISSDTKKQTEVVTSTGMSSGDIKVDILQDTVSSGSKTQKSKENDISDGRNEQSLIGSKAITPVVTPLTPKSVLFSSDEEYRTASEGGRRDSVDWGSPLSPSPPVPLILARTKERLRTRSTGGSTNIKLTKRSRSSPPTSRRSTIDSVGSDELPSAMNAVQEDISRNLQLQLENAEKEIALLKLEAEEQNSKRCHLIETFEEREMSLNLRIKEAEEARDLLAKQMSENRSKAENLIERLTQELEENRLRCRNLEGKLNQGIEENESLYKKIREIENSSTNMLTNLSKGKLKRVDSLSDLTNLNDIDPFCLERDSLADEYSELRSRFEKAVNEIRAMKKELKESQNQYDSLELAHVKLRQDFERRESHYRSQVQLMGARIQDLTVKYTNSDRQVRLLKQKLAKSEKRRSLSLKGKESRTIQKELEDKVSELENKIDVLEIETSSSPKPISSDVEVKPSPSSVNSGELLVHPSSVRLRRKSLDSSPSESVQILLRLNTLEERIDKAYKSQKVNSDCGSSHSNTDSSPIKISEHLIERLRCLEGVVITSKERVEQSLQQLHCLKSSKTRRSVSPIADRKDSYRFIERSLIEASKVLRDCCENCVVDTCPAVGKLILLPETDPIKLALTQLESQLRNKLSDLLKQRRVLRERNELTPKSSLQLLAERIAYESVCFGKLRDAISRAEDPSQFGEKQTQAEATETSQLISLLKAKLSGQCAIRPSGTLDILASVLARRLVLSANRTGPFKVPEMAPISPSIMDDLIRQQNELHIIAKRYKTNAMETLACGLAAETLSYISSTDAVQGAVQEAWRQAQETVNAELVQSEIAHIMMRNSSRFENAITPSFGFTLTSQERVSFENFADAVQDELRKEMDIAIAQLTQCYEENLAKMKKGQWRLHLEQERKASEERQLLAEFADIVAHKALIDARISVLKGDYVSKTHPLTKDDTFSLVTLQKYENLFSELAADLQISNPDDILAEADFNFMYKHFTADFVTNKGEIYEVSEVLHKLEQTVVLLQTTLNPNTNFTTTNFKAETLHDICNKCQDLQNRVEPLIPSALSLQAACDDCEKLKNTLEHLTEQHDNDLDDLRKSHEHKFDALKQQFDEQLRITRALETEKHQILNQLSMEREMLSQREVELDVITKKLEKQEMECHLKIEDNFVLVGNLEAERKMALSFKEESSKLLEEHKNQTDSYNALLQERDFILEQLDKERDRVRKLEKRLEILQEEQSQQIESLHAAYKEQQLSMNVSELTNEEEANFKLRYQAEIEQLRTLCEKGLVAMESSHRRIVSELEEKHRQEVQRLLCEKEQALAEETQATLAALDAMRKAHQSEVQREVARFKSEFVHQFQKGGGHLSDAYRSTEEELDEVREEILSLSEKYSVKCVEAATLEEKCRVASHQLKYYQQHVQQLENRNKQLRVHLACGDQDFCTFGLMSTKDSANSLQEHVDETMKKHFVDDRSKEFPSAIRTKKGLERSSKLNYNEGIKCSSTQKPSNNKTINDSSSSSLMQSSPKSTSKALQEQFGQSERNCSGTNITTAKKLQSDDNDNVLKLCSPPPLDGKDVEHNIRRFELEI